MTNCIAFSARTREHTSIGNPDVIRYEILLNNQGGAWDNQDFTAPEDGCYHFALSFMRDGYSKGGTSDDVYVYLVKNGSSVGLAWAGEGDGSRASASLALTLMLKAGDKVCAKAGSDAGRNRYIREAYFTGYKVG